jgi:hypothetical protein
MTITHKYVDFILDSIIQDRVTVQLYKPCENGSRVQVKLGPTVHCKVKIEVVEKYSRSAKLKLTFDRYEIEQIFFMPCNSSPDSIEFNTVGKIEKLVNKTFIDDSRTEDIKQMYEKENRRLAEAFSKIVGRKVK